MAYKSNKQRARADRKQKRILKKRCLVYALKDPDSDEIRYVGQTRSTLETRLRNHLRKVVRSQQQGERLSPVGVWLDALLQDGKAPKIELLDDFAMWDVAEAAWIERVSAAGHDLLNVASRIKAMPVPMLPRS